MRIYEEQIRVPLPAQSNQFLSHIAAHLGENLPADAMPLGNPPFDPQLAEEFWRAVANTGQMNLHVVCHYGRNAHHIVEGVFKATARALRMAVEKDPRESGVPSTKGVL